MAEGTGWNHPGRGSSTWHSAQDTATSQKPMHDAMSWQEVALNVTLPGT